MSKYVKFYADPSEKVRAECTCMLCLQVTNIFLEVSKYDEWKREGEYIQNVFPEMSVDQREQLISGTCPKCWDKHMKE